VNKKKIVKFGGIIFVFILFIIGGFLLLNNNKKKDYIKFGQDSYNEAVKPVVGIGLNCDEDIYMETGTYKSLEVTLAPLESDFSQIEWTTSDSAVAVVDSHNSPTAAVIYANAAGTTTITASINDKKDSCVVHVVDKSSVAIVENDDELIASVYSTNENYTYKWYFENKKISGENTDKLPIDEPGVYKVEIINSEGEVLATDTYQYESPALINYSLNTDSKNKTIFINNPETLKEEYMADGENKTILYSTKFNGTAELFFEHVRAGNIKKDYYYAIRLYNPNSTSVTIKINKSGASICHNNCSTWTETWRKYYTKNVVYRQNVTPAQSYAIGARGYLYLYFTPDTDLNDLIDDTRFATYTNNKPSAQSLVSYKKWGFDGVLNMTSSNEVEVSTLIFREYSSIIDKANQPIRDSKGQITGEYIGAPIVQNSVTFFINDDTPEGNLAVQYNPSSDSSAPNKIYDHWRTNISGANSKTSYQREVIPFNQTYSKKPYIAVYEYDETEQKNVFKYINKNSGWIDMTIKPFSEKGSYANYGVHYYEDITIVNNSSETKKVAFVVNTGSGTETSAASTNLVSFVTDDNHSSIKEGSYSYNDITITPTTTFQKFPYRTFVKVWQAQIPAGERIKVNSIVILGGMSYGNLEKMVCINKCKDNFNKTVWNLD